jgi:hypothetical protein
MNNEKKEISVDFLGKDDVSIEFPDSHYTITNFTHTKSLRVFLTREEAGKLASFITFAFQDKDIENGK